MTDMLRAWLVTLLMVSLAFSSKILADSITEAAETLCECRGVTK